MFTVLATTLLMVSDLSLDNRIEPWLIVNDGVMGGVSSGRLERDGETLVFSGELSLENNGGFASIRRSVEAVPSAADAVQIEVRGDGRRYQFRLRTDSNFDGVAWVSEFDTSPEWQTVTLDLSGFEPRFRGRRLGGQGGLDASLIRQAGFLLADKREGPFRLEFRAIRFTSRTPSE